jgi:twitching motility two-component system response regulator PilG
VLPDVVLVNADDPAALQNWERFASGAGKACAAIMLTKQRGAGGFRYSLVRPASGRDLLVLLEKVAVEVHGHSAPPAFDTYSVPVIVPSAGLSTGKGVRALVVDDSLPVRIQMKQALENVADEVDFAENGEDAMDLISRRQYHIIFLDVVLPGSYNGYQICKAIKEKAERRATPVIMLTSNSSPADRIKGKLAGCDTYLIKPVKQAVFEEVVKEFVRPAALA